MTHCSLAALWCKGGTALAAAGALTGPALLDWAKAWAQTAPWKPEKGAQLSMLRWKYFVQSEDDAFVEADRRLHQGDRRQGQDLARILRRRAAEGLGRRQHRRRAGPVLGPLFAAASVPAEVRRRHRRRRLSRQEVRRLGRQRGRSYGKSGNKWIAIPICYSGNLMNYRISRVAEGGLLEIPGDTDEFLEYAKAMKKNNTPGGLALGHASGDGNAWMHWCLWAHGGNARRQERQGHHQLAGDREGARIRQGALREHDPRHRVVERRLQQQGVPGRRNLTGPTTASRSTSRPTRTRPRRRSPRT